MGVMNSGEVVMCRLVVSLSASKIELRDAKGAMRDQWMIKELVGARPGGGPKVADSRTEHRVALTIAPPSCKEYERFLFFDTGAMRNRCLVGSKVLIRLCRQQGLQGQGIEFASTLQGMRK